MKLRLVLVSPARATKQFVALLVAVAGNCASAVPMQVAYVANSDDDTVSVIALATQQVIDTIDVGLGPRYVAFSPDNRRAYITNFDSHDVSVINTALGSVIDTIAVGTMPGRLVVSLDGGRVYVANTGSSNISVIDTATDSVIDTVATPSEPGPIAYHPIRDELWIGLNPPGGVGTMLEVRSSVDYSVLASRDTQFAFPSPSNRAWASVGLMFRDDGSEAFGSESCGFCGRFHRIAGVHAGGSIALFEEDILFDNTGSATGMAINPVDGTVYLAKQGQNGTPSVNEYGGLGRTLNFGSHPRDMAVTPNGDVLYVVHQATPGFVSLVDTTTFSVLDTISVGARPEGIAMVVIGVTADFNSDGDADGGDFLAWQRGFGKLSNVSLADGDANGDGAVAGADLAIWQSRYGESSSTLETAAVVPEPGTFFLLLIGLALHVNRSRT